MTLGGLLCGGGWAHDEPGQESAGALRCSTRLTGVGAALVYCGSMGVALKWFPDKRGLAAGITAAAFGSGAALFIPLIAHLLKSDGYRTTFIYTGICQGFLIICAAQFLRSPKPGEVAAAPAQAQRFAAAARISLPAQMLRTSHFYVLYLMMFIMGVGGLMVTAQSGSAGGHFQDQRRRAHYRRCP